ncbi:hypothetical protein IscW_ISCW001969, partial [Ixodes scapularis]
PDPGSTFYDCGTFGGQPWKPVRMVVRAGSELRLQTSKLNPAEDKGAQGGSRLHSPYCW